MKSETKRVRIIIIMLLIKRESQKERYCPTWGSLREDNRNGSGIISLFSALEWNPPWLTP